MVAHFTMSTHGVVQAFRFVKGIWLHQKSKKNVGKDLFYIIRAQHVLSFHLIQVPWGDQTRANIGFYLGAKNILIFALDCRAERTCIRWKKKLYSNPI